MADWIDTHAHLDSKQLADDLPAVLTRARAASVTRMIAVGITAESSRRCVELAEREPDVFATVGVHPNDILHAADGDRERIVALLERPRVVGVGETGLDRYWKDTPFEIQREWFAWHLELGRRFQRAVVIHCRDAEPDMLEALRETFAQHGPIRGVMHSFVGSAEMANACLEMGLHLSFAGMLTYKNAQALRETAAHLPLERVLVETDCPYLSPVPLRGKRNEPANVVHTGRCLAETLGVSEEQLATQTTRNACALFGVPA